MNLQSIIQEWKQVAKPTRATLAKDLLNIIGFYVTTENNGIHWKIREATFNVDFWPTTERLSVRHKNGITESFQGFENIVVKLVRLALRNENEN